jgi:HEAT repeat protein
MFEATDVNDRGARKVDTSIEPLLAQLASRDGIQRRKARERLVDIGKPAIPHLMSVLQSPLERSRWEAAKALGEMREPAAAPALVQALEDEESAIRWLAATGLIRMGRACLGPLLEALEGRSNSVWVREGAHRVLHFLIRDGVADEAIPVLEALEDIEPAVEVPIAAYHALKKLRHEPEASIEDIEDGTASQDE